MSTIVATILIVALLAIGGFWLVRSKPEKCVGLKTVMVSLNVAAAVLGAVYLLAGISTHILLTTVSILCFLNLGFLVDFVLKKYL